MYLYLRTIWHTSIAYVPQRRRGVEYDGTPLLLMFVGRLTAAAVGGLWNKAGQCLNTISSNRVFPLFVCFPFVCLFSLCLFVCLLAVGGLWNKAGQRLNTISSNRVFPLFNQTRDWPVSLQRWKPNLKCWLFVQIQVSDFQHRLVRWQLSFMGIKLYSCAEHHSKPERNILLGFFCSGVPAFHRLAGTRTTFERSSTFALCSLCGRGGVWEGCEIHLGDSSS